jgi:hypothetical protein
MTSAYILADLPYAVYTMALVVYDTRLEKFFLASEICRATCIIIKLFVYYTFKGLYRRRVNRFAHGYFGCGSSEGPIYEQDISLEENRLDDSTAAED